MSRTWETRVPGERAIGRQVGGTETTSREARNDRETDQSIVLRDGRTVHTGKGLNQHRGGRGLGSDGMANICEPLTKRRENQQAKGAEQSRLEPKGTWLGAGASRFPCRR